MKVCLSVLAVAALCYATPAKLRAEKRFSTTEHPDPEPVPRVRTFEPLPDGAQVDRIVIYKGARRLEVYDGLELVKRYAVAVGSGRGDKRREGDRRTPVGRYRINGRHKSRQFHMFLSISYPSREDRRRFLRLKRRGEIPADARIGGAIGIHGERQSRISDITHKIADWTAGCIALDDHEIEELYAAVQPGAEVIIHP